MTLLEFIIKISLRGSRAAAELAGIMRASDRTRRSMDNAGRATERYRRGLSRVKNEANSTTSALARLMRSTRFGGGVRFAGVTAGSSSSLSGIAGLAGVSGGAAAGVGALVVAVAALAAVSVAAAQRLQTLQDLQNAAVLALPANNPAEARAMMAQLRRQQEQGVSRIVEGRNVLDMVGAAPIATAQAELLKAGIPLADVLEGRLVAAFVSLQQTDPTASVESITQAIANAGPLAQQSGQSIETAAYQVAGIAAATKFSVQDVARSMATVAPQARQVGVTMNEMSAAMILAETGFSTARHEAQGLRRILNSVFVQPRIPMVQEIERANNLRYVNAQGQFVGFMSMREQLQRLQTQIDPAQFQEYLTRRFGALGKQAITAILQATDDQVRQAQAQVSRSEQAMDNALAARADSISAGWERMGRSWDRFVLALDRLGLGEGVASILNNTAAAIESFAGFIERNSERIKTAANIATWLNPTTMPHRVGEAAASLFRRTPTTNTAARGTAATPAAARPAAAVQTQAQAQAVVADTRAAQTQIVTMARDIQGLAVDAQNKVRLFQPMLAAAQQFANGMGLWVETARHRSEAEMLLLLSNLLRLQPQFAFAGESLGRSFAMGLRTQMALASTMTPVLARGTTIPAGPSITNNNQWNIRGGPDRATVRTMRGIAQGVESSRGARRNGAR